MSSGSGARRRTRPTREETRLRLLDGAARVFAAKGIGAATIEDICEAAGFSRGAFYSNFEAKDELALALLDHYFEANQAEIERLFAESDSPAEFLAAMDSDERRMVLSVDDPGMLYMELILHAMRDPRNRPRLIERQQRSLEVLADFVTRIAAIDGLDIPGGALDAAHLLLAFDSGLMLHGLIDPDGHDPHRWSRTVLTLYGLWRDASPARGGADEVSGKG